MPLWSSVVRMSMSLRSSEPGEAARTAPNSDSVDISFDAGASSATRSFRDGVVSNGHRSIRPVLKR